MKRQLLIFSLLILPTLANAQEPTEFTIKITPLEVELIWRGLRKLPLDEVEVFINKYRQQVIDQSKPKPNPNPQNTIGEIKNNQGIITQGNKPVEPEKK